MPHLCQHCATPYTPSPGLDGFCCLGCQQVYTLIQSEGLDDYYRLQDRASQPLKDRKLSDVDVAALHRAQEVAEEQGDPTQAIYRMNGMSCLGCAWLIERLALGRSGLDLAEVSLTENTLRLQWKRGTFDLADLAEELHRFGYRIDAQAVRSQDISRISPIALRLLLVSVFLGNVLLLVAYEQFVSVDKSHGDIINLLILACLSFVCILGAAPFFLTVRRAWSIRRVHSDLIPSVAILSAHVYVLLIAQWPMSFSAVAVSLLVWVFVAARWLGSLFSKRISSSI